MLRTACLSLALLGLVAAAPASATTLSASEGRLIVTAAEGEENAIEINMLDTGPLIVRDMKAPISGCGPFNHPEMGRPGDLICQAVGSPVVTLGDGDDSVGVSDAGTDSPIGVTEVDGGTGDDTIGTSNSNDVLVGGAGDDTLNAGEQGDDRLEGGPGADKLYGNWENDTLIGGPDADTLDGGEGDDTFSAADGSRDVVRCGVGADTVTADPVDELTECETVTRVGADGQPIKRDPVSGPGFPSPAPAPAPAPAPRADLPRDGLRKDRVAPKLQVSARKRVLTLRADEACTVTIKAGRKTITRRLKPGAKVVVKVPGKARAVAITARDAAGNATRVARRLKR